MHDTPHESPALNQSRESATANGPANSIEWIRRVAPAPISHVVFDFDGTLSWLRHGWPKIMLDLFREHFPARPAESSAETDAILNHAILSLNGKPTIFQMHRFAELAAERGATSPEPESLRAEYQRRLDVAIEERSQRVRSGAARQGDYLLFGARPLVEYLVATGKTVIILSSTVVERVSAEAELLGIAGHFGRHIYGGVGDPLKFSKRAVFERLLAEENISGRNLLSFGDGPVELADTKDLGGIAVAVCSDEHENGSGRCDPEKRRQLMAAGADVVIPDFRDAIELVDRLSEGNRLSEGS